MAQSGQQQQQQQQQQQSNSQGEKQNKGPQASVTQAQDASQDVAKGAQDKAQNVTSGVLGWVQEKAGSVTAWGKGVLDRFIPPERRAELLAKLQNFMLANPKLSSFLGMNIALTGVPLGLFFLFSLTVLIFSLVVGLLLGLLFAVAFTLFCVGVALTIVLPTIFFTTAAATFLFLWGLGGYYLLQWLNSASDEGEGEKGGQGGGKTVGDYLNSFTGGRLTGFMDSAKADQAKGSIEGFGDQHAKPGADGKGANRQGQ